MAQITVDKFTWTVAAQSAHISVAALVMIACARFHANMWYAIPVCVAAAAVKEFWYDYQYEDAATRGSSLLDFSMYMCGIVVGFFLR